MKKIKKKLSKNTSAKRKRKKKLSKNTSAKRKPKKKSFKNTSAKRKPKKKLSKNTSAKRKPKKKSFKNISIKRKPKKKSFKNISIKRKPKKKFLNKKKTGKKILKKNKLIKIKNFRNITKPKIKKKESLISKIVKLQYSYKPEFKIKINFSLEKYIQAFFDKIASTISEYKILKEDEKRKRKLADIEKIEKEKILIQKQKQKEEELKTKFREKSLKQEAKLEKERARDIKLFLRKEQAILRIEQNERQKQFLKQLQLEKLIERFRIREVKELEKLEKISFKEKREDYGGLQERIEKLKAKYRVIRDQKIRERVEALGVTIQGNEDRETLLQKEKEYTTARQKIELSLESFYRSANSLVFQLNKRHITRHMSIFRCIDRRFETGEIFIKWDESNDEEWLLLIYIKNNSPDEGIIIEDKSNPEKNLSHEFKSTEIFKASDLMVDALTQLIARVRAKKRLD